MDDQNVVHGNQTIVQGDQIIIHGQVHMLGHETNLPCNLTSSQASGAVEHKSDTGKLTNWCINNENYSQYFPLMANLRNWAIPEITFIPHKEDMGTPKIAPPKTKQNKNKTKQNKTKQQQQNRNRNKTKNKNKNKNKTKQNTKNLFYFDRKGNENIATTNIFDHFY